MTTFGAKEFNKANDAQWLRRAAPLFVGKLKDLKKGHACQLTISTANPFEGKDGSVCGQGTFLRVEMLANAFRDGGWHVEISNSTSFGVYFLTFTMRPTAWEHIDDPSV